MSTPPVRVRFAPSPTGHAHIGSARTALYNFLLARQTGGAFILRIEDTDQKRSAPEYYEEMREALGWLGLHWDEGPDVGGPHAPYSQMARKAIYQEYAQQLVQTGHAYPCFCGPLRLQQVRELQQRRREPPRYDGLCRALTEAEAQARIEAGEPYVIRFKTPREGSTTAVDRLRGEITVENRNLDDYVLVKSDGLALYHLAAMVDDHLMGITHVFRGAEWLPTFPLHALIIRAFGWTEPAWIHLSVFLNPGGKGKMSKRNLKSEQEIFVLGLREQGYLPEAVVNWIALMGASFDPDEDVFTVDELIRRFDLAHLNPAPARVNFEKLDHFNGVHIRRLPEEELARRLVPFFERTGLTSDPAALRKIVPIIQTRMTTLDEAVELAGFFFREQVVASAEELVGKNMTPAESAAALRRAIEALAGVPGFEAAATEPPLRALAEELGLKAGQLFGILRAAVTGQTVSPPLFETMAIVGRPVVLRRLEGARSTLEAMS